MAMTRPRPGGAFADRYVAGMDCKIELVAISVTDADRATAFSVAQVGFRADHDHRVDDLRFGQLLATG